MTTSSISPKIAYQNALEKQQFMADNVQLSAIEALDEIYHAILQFQQTVQNQPDSRITHNNNNNNNNNNNLKQKLFGLLKMGLAKNSPQPSKCNKTPVQGLYMWGGVGRGKTWLMDLFYDCLPVPRKQRMHFHRFMLHVHETLNQLQGEENPIEIVADRFAEQTDILCFDEFFVSDITDAMILGGLLQALFTRGITLIATSNIPPDELYRNGLQRARFLPAIEQIKQFCKIMNIDSGIDYRLRTLTHAKLFYSPLNQTNDLAIRRLYEQLSSSKVNTQPEITTLNHHPFKIESQHHGIALIDFHTLCVEPRNTHDFIEIAKRFHTVVVQNIAQMHSQDESTARRFIALIDEFYERKVKLILTSETAIETIYQGELLTFEFKRCLSRLQEMQSEEYLTLVHLA